MSLNEEEKERFNKVIDDILLPFVNENEEVIHTILNSDPALKEKVERKMQQILQNRNLHKSGNDEQATGEKITNLDKMNALLVSEMTMEEMKQWVFKRLLFVENIHEEEEFYSMENSVRSFNESIIQKLHFPKLMDEFTLWEKFLESEYVL